MGTWCNSLLRCCIQQVLSCRNLSGWNIGACPIVVSGGDLFEGYEHDRPGICPGNGQTEAEIFVSQVGYGDTILHCIPPPDLTLFIGLSRAVGIGGQGRAIFQSHHPFITLEKKSEYGSYQGPGQFVLIGPLSIYSLQCLFVADLIFFPKVQSNIFCVIHGLQEMNQ